MHRFPKGLEMKRITSKRSSIGFTALFFLGLASAAGHPPGAEGLNVRFSAKPDHAILFVIDGLSYKAFDRVDLPVLKKMIATGAFVEQDFLPPAAHPHSGPYAKLHTCSIPNPIMMAGTIFITENTKYLSGQFFPDRTTAFCVNTLDYQTLNTHYHYSFQKNGEDGEPVEMALLFMEAGRPAFTRIHLQDTGYAGFQTRDAKADAAWRQNIWAEGSPYRKKLREADALLGRLIDGLQEIGLLEKTVLVVLGDHGQADTGGHPLQAWDPSVTSIVLWGAGVRTGVRIPYAEQIDVVPTVCTLMGVKPPETSLGRVIAEALADESLPVAPQPMLIRKMNEQFQEFNRIAADIAARIDKTGAGKTDIAGKVETAKKNFYDIGRFTEWPRFKTVDELIGQNGRALETLRRLAAGI